MSSGTLRKGQQPGNAKSTKTQRMTPMEEKYLITIKGTMEQDGP